jgi:hypothetical protein
MTISSNETLVLLIFITTLVSLAEALADTYWMKKKKIEHTISATIRLCSVVFVSMYLFVFPSFIWVSITLLSHYWIVFDITINLARNMNWLYIGKTSKMDIYARKKTDKGGYLMIKIFIYVTALTLYHLV